MAENWAQRRRAGRLESTKLRPNMPITSPPLDDACYQALVDDILRRIPSQTPEWTGTDPSDPGITLVELFAYLSETLLDRATNLPDRRRQAAVRLAVAAQALASASVPKEGSADQPCGLDRITYFAGRLLSAEDLTAEQNYHREKLRRHNRHLHGTGIVDGLGVRLDTGSGKTAVRVEPGIALDPYGEELAVCEALSLSLPVPTPDASILVELAYSEHPTRPVPAPEELAGTAGLRYSRVVETCVASLSPTATPTPGAVVLAHLKTVRGRWAIDRRFKARRIGFPPGQRQG